MQGKNKFKKGQVFVFKAGGAKKNSGKKTKATNIPKPNIPAPLSENEDEEKRNISQVISKIFIKIY